MNKILYISHTSEIGGAERSLLYLLKDLDRSKFNPIVVLKGNGPLVEYLRKIKVKTYTYPLSNIEKKKPVSIFFYLRTMLGLVRIIKCEKISCIHCNMYMSNQYAIPASFLTGVPLLCHIRNIITKSCYYNDLLFLTRKLIANSKATEQSYGKYLKENQESVVIYNSVPLDRNYSGEKTDAFRQKYGIKKNAFLIGYAGQIQEVKGLHFLIEAVGKITDKYPHVRLFVAGNDALSGETQYFSNLKAKCEKLGLNNIVTFGGFLHNMQELYFNMDVLVLPSVYEPFGRVLIEAMALKKPVVSTLVGGIPEVVEDGVTGYLVPPGDPVSLAESITRLIDDTGTAKRFGKKGRERAEKYFDSTTNTRQIENIYEEILAVQ